MSFEVPDQVDWREVKYLKDMCLVSLFELNKDIFRAVVLCAFRDFHNDPAFSRPNSFHIFCVTLSLEMRDAYSQRGERSGEPPKALTRVIWEHLELRGNVKGPPQVAFKAAKPIYDAFARFIAIQALSGRLPIPETDLNQARATREAVERGTARLCEVLTIKNPFNPYSADC